MSAKHLGRGWLLPPAFPAGLRPQAASILAVRERIFARVRPTASWPGSRRRGFSDEEEAQDPDRVADVEAAVVVGVGGIPAGRTGFAEELASEYEERIREIDAPVTVGVPAHELGANRPDLEVTPSEAW